MTRRVLTYVARGLFLAAVLAGAWWSLRDEGDELVDALATATAGGLVLSLALVIGATFLVQSRTILLRDSPEPPASSHRSDDGASVMRVAVVGAGVIGFSTALALRRCGHTVEVFEAAEAGRGSSWAGAGILYPLLPWHYDAVVNQWCLRGIALQESWVESLREASGIDAELACDLLGLGRSNAMDIGERDFNALRRRKVYTSDTGQTASPERPPASPSGMGSKTLSKCQRNANVRPTPYWRGETRAHREGRYL